MGASLSSRFSSAKAEESPSTVVDVVPESEAMTMVGAEGASTSARTEYYSARCVAMLRSEDHFSDDVALEIEFSKPHWSEVSRLEVAPQSAEEEELNRENREVLKQLRKDHPRFFAGDLSRVVLGRMIAKGGQAGIYEVVNHRDTLVKVFERGTSLRDLRQSCPLPVLNKDIRQCIYLAGMLLDGRFAFMMWRFWGDLRKMIDQAMVEKNVDGMQGPPFPYKWKDYRRWTFETEDFMLSIAQHMVNIHKKGISHRDLKASNILISNTFELSSRQNFFDFKEGIIVADFECSIGVLGTKYWRAPEILAALGNVSTITNEQWKKADVYSYGMVCFEIVTGRMPFDGELRNTEAERQLVIEGKRPQLPSDLDDAMKNLIMKCWESNPSLRPTFFEIVEIIKTICTTRCQFKLFGIDDELPQQYCLATVEEVNEYTGALMKAMPGWEIANLANGSVDGYRYGMETSLVKRGDATHKLARHLWIHLLDEIE